MSGKGETILRNLVGAHSNGCVHWPLSTYRNGYGQCWFRGRLMPAHRVMTILAHGEPPSPLQQAAHICGVRPCVNPLHLRWATQSENEIDKRAHGTSQQGERNPSAKLTEYDVSVIKALLPMFPDRILGPFFSVDRKNISAIRARRTWAWVLPRAEIEVQEIVNQLEAKAA